MLRRSIVSLVALLVVAFSLPASADVVLTFDNDTEGFAVTGTTAGAAVSHAVVGGEGMLKLEAPGGWAGDMAKWTFFSGAFFDEVTAAVNNGGTLSYDILIVEADQTLTGSPAWFENTHISQGQFASYDSDTVGYGIGSGNWPLTGGQFATTTTVPITATAAAASDLSAHFDAADTWRNLHLGLNNDGGSVTTAVVYFDNVTVSANVAAVPEPSAFALLGVCGLFGFVRRRR